MNEWMSEWLLNHPWSLIWVLFLLLGTYSDKKAVFTVKCTVLTVTSCICIGPDSEQLVRSASWPSTSGFIIHLHTTSTLKGHMVQPHGAAHQTTPVITRMVGSLKGRPPPAGHVSPRHTLLTLDWSTCMVSADWLPTTVHDLDWSRLSGTAAWCCPGTGMTDSPVIMTISGLWLEDHMLF